MDIYGGAISSKFDNAVAQGLNALIELIEMKLLRRRLLALQEDNHTPIYGRTCHKSPYICAPPERLELSTY
jgi:hypothetical protein